VASVWRRSPRTDGSGATMTSGILGRDPATPLPVAASCSAYTDAMVTAPSGPDLCSRRHTRRVSTGNTQTGGCVTADTHLVRQLPLCCAR
jgi:hypothetical protein